MHVYACMFARNDCMHEKNVFEVVYIQVGGLSGSGGGPGIKKPMKN